VALAIALALLAGGTIATLRVRQELARRAVVLQAQQVAQERARLNQFFAAHQKTLRELEALADQRDALRARSTNAATQTTTTSRPTGSD
jgi:hypothetical protein